jgi:hypothetical protein
MEIYKTCIYDLNIIEALNKTDFEEDLKKEICNYISELKEKLDKCEKYCHNNISSEYEDISGALEDILNIIQN